MTRVLRLALRALLRALDWARDRCDDCDDPNCPSNPENGAGML